MPVPGSDRSADADAIPGAVPRPLPWLDRNWPYAGAVAAAFLLGLLPVAIAGRPPAVALVYLLLLAYLVHQVEEHRGDRFRRFVNAHVAGGRDALTPRAAMWTNVGVVWLNYVVVLLMTAFVDPGIGLVAVYVTLANAAVHLAAAVAMRRYNPGLCTAVALFIPMGVLGWPVAAAASGIGWAGHVLGIGAAVLVHAAIAAHVLRHARG